MVFGLEGVVIIFGEPNSRECVLKVTLACALVAAVFMVLQYVEVRARFPAGFPMRDV